MYASDLEIVELPKWKPLYCYHVVTNFNELSYFLALDGYHILTVSLTGTRREREEFLECSLICKLCCCPQISSGSKVGTGILIEGRESLDCSQRQIFSAIISTCHTYEYYPLATRGKSNSRFMVTPCINNSQHFNFQLMHTTLKNVELF